MSHVSRIILHSIIQRPLIPQPPLPPKRLPILARLRLQLHPLPLRPTIRILMIPCLVDRRRLPHRPIVRRDLAEVLVQPRKDNQAAADQREGDLGGGPEVGLHVDEGVVGAAGELDGVDHAKEGGDACAGLFRRGGQF